MTTMFDERTDWKRDIAFSLLLHSCIGVAIIAISIARLGQSGNNWGGPTAGEGAINATLVSSAPAIPLPSPKQPTENVVATENKGVAQPEPEKKAPPPPPEPKAVEIPDKAAKLKPSPHAIEAPPKNVPKAAEAPRPSASTIKPTKPQPANVVPYGEGGRVNIPMAVNTTAGTGGIAIAGGGDFGSRFSWYVDNIRRKVSDNWMKYEVDPHTVPGRRVYLTFDISRDGNPSNIQIAQPSGVPSLDYSAVNALRRIDTFGPLPPDYRGSRVSVQFYFDYKQ